MRPLLEEGRIKVEFYKAIPTVVGGLLVLVSADAFAYLDPATGSIIL